MLSYLCISDMTKVKNFFSDLISLYTPLLATDSQNEPESANGQSKEMIK